MQNISFTGFMTKMNDRFGRGQPILARRKTEKVELPGTGKIKTGDFKTFEIQFSDALKNIRDIGLEEARRLLLCKLHDWMRVWVVEEEAKRNPENPALLFGGVPGMSKAQASQTIKNFLERPRLQSSPSPPRVSSWQGSCASKWH